MVVTDGRGKAGGQYIRKFGANHVLQNITVPTRRLASLQNVQRLLNAWLFSLWANLPAGDKLAWNTVASNLTAYDVFGTARAVSGREAFNKCNMVVYPYTLDFVDPATFVYEVPFNNAIGFATNFNLGEFTIATSGTSTFDFFEIRAKRLKFLGQKVDVKALKIFMRSNDIGSPDAIWDAFVAAYPQVAIGQFYSVAIRFVNLSGVSSPFFQYPTIID